MKRVLLASASALAIMTGAAFAADFIAPEPVPVPTWTGLHVGVGGGAGYNFYDAESEFAVDADGGPDNFLAIEADDLGAWYAFGTVEVGYDYQFDNSPFVIGILANYDFNGNSSADAESFAEDDDGNVNESRIEAEIEDTWFVGGRLGLAHENTLFYGLGGYTWANANFKAEHQTNNPFPDGTEFDEDESVDGWTIGAGIEHMLTDALSLKVEYRHDFLDDVDFDGFANDPDEDDGGIDDDNTHAGQADFSRDTIRAVLSWRFNMGL